MGIIKSKRMPTWLKSSVNEVKTCKKITCQNVEFFFFKDSSFGRTNGLTSM